MADKIPLHGHISQTCINEVYRAFKPLLQSTAVRYFCYLRRYSDGRFTFLPTEKEFGSYLFQDEVYPDTWFAGIPFNELKSGYSYWDLAKQVSSHESNAIAKEIEISFNLKFGVEIIEKYEDYCDFYSFSGDDVAVYFIPLSTFYQFIFYFREHCNNLMGDAYRDLLQFPDYLCGVTPIPIAKDTGLQNVKADDLGITRYYLQGNYEGIYLTRRELELLQHLQQGSTAKCIASQLSISARTLENHIKNVKNKLGVKRTAEILHIARESKLLSA